MSPGQGVQQPGMGEEAYSASEKTRKVFDVASEVTGIDISEVCFGSATERLNETLIAQPAIAAVTIAEYYNLKKIGLRPDVGMGHSMGEIPLLAMVGALSIRDTFNLLQTRADVTSRANEERPGAMLAIWGLVLEQVKEKSAPVLASGRAAIANINSRSQHVFSGDYEQIHRLERAIKHMKLTGKTKVGFKRLPIDGAFHSPYHMEKAAEEFYEAARKINFLAPEFDVMLNNGQYLSELKTDNLAKYLSEQLIKGVNFVEGTQRVIDDGVTNFVEVGPIGPKAKYKTLSALIKRDFEQEVHIVEIREVADGPSPRESPRRT